MEVWLAKLVSLFLLLLVAIVCGLLSVKLLNAIGWRRGQGLRRTKAAVFIDGLNCFAGGVFFATSMLHLLPDVRRDIDAILIQLNKKNDLPLAEFLTSIGVFLVMFLEQSMIQCRQNRSKKMYGGDDYSDENLELQLIDRSQEPEIDDLSQTQSTLLLENGNLSNGGVVGETPAHTSSNRPSQIRNASSTRVTRSMVLLLALSTHTVFEGLALGLQQTLRDVWTLFTAILLHKIIMSFAAGLQFAESLRSTSKTVFCILAFSVMAPVGVAVGLAVTEVGYQGLATRIASAVLQGLATGTFIYVTFFEILMEQLTKNQSVLKVIFTIVGFTCIAALNSFTKDKDV